MKFLIRTFLFFVAAVAVANRVQAAPAPQVSVSIAAFHDGLSPYGDWVASARFGQVWAPRGIHSTWRPYSAGYWTYTDVGWTWVSDEPWGWATYHYGRWSFDNGLGWVWVPDTVWGPSWVAWRYSNDYVGWAPLPPGIAVSEDFEPPLEPFAFMFVRTSYLCDRHVISFIEPPARNVTFVRLTQNETHFTVHGDVFFNRGPRVELVEHAIGRPVPRLTIQATETIGLSHVDRDRVVIYRPSVEVLSGHAVVGPVGPAYRARVETPAQMAARHTVEVHALEVDQARERDALEARHRTELSHPPVGMTHEQVVARQETEHKAQQEEEIRQKQVLAARHDRETHDHGRGQQ